MRTRVEPAFADWALPEGTNPRRALVELVNANARRLGTGPMDSQSGENQPIIATGHQAFFYHPGILAKDMAADLAATRFGARPLHLVVDQDVHEALTVRLPVESDGRLSVRRLRLGPEDPQVPTGFQPSADLEQSPGKNDLPIAFRQALENLPPTRTLAEQITAALGRLRNPFSGNLPVLFCSDLPHLNEFQDLVGQMLAQPRTCARAYNQAVAAHPHAGVGPLAVELDRVELPLWVCRWQMPRLRVFADLADSTPRLIDEQDQPIDFPPTTTEPSPTILPRALTMTVAMRSWLCDFFIHGQGGWTYDRITEQWWHHWRGQTLAPMAMVSADLHLDFNVPQNNRTDLQRALWHIHHLPHNLDRELSPAQLDGQIELVHQKADLLNHMDDDRDRRRRRRAFNEIHRINDHLAQTHPEPLRQAQHNLDRARLGLTNQRLTTKRDWPFPLYPPKKLHDLRQRLDPESPPAPAGGLIKTLQR